jgi:hypothetical protein
MCYMSRQAGYHPFSEPNISGVEIYFKYLSSSRSNLCISSCSFLCLSGKRCSNTYGTIDNLDVSYSQQRQRILQTYIPIYTASYPARLVLMTECLQYAHTRNFVIKFVAKRLTCGAPCNQKLTSLAEWHFYLFYYFEMTGISVV